MLSEFRGSICDYWYRLLLRLPYPLTGFIIIRSVKQIEYVQQLTKKVFELIDEVFAVFL